MLRHDHMPSDFNPIYLFLGDERDLAGLADMLRTFASGPHPMRLSDAIPDAISRTALTLTPETGDGGDYGLRVNDDGSFRWGLNAWQADQIAQRIDGLTPPENKSGSDIFELGIPGEIPVKVSRGEFEDEFLVRKF